VCALCDCSAAQSGGSCLPVNRLRNRVAAALLLSLVIGAPASSQPRATSVDPIPAVEQFVQRTGLRVRLTVVKASVAAFEDPGFVVHFDNVGYTLLRVNPIVAGLYIDGEDGRLAPPAASWITEFIGPAPLKNKQVVRLRPGQTLSRRVHPQYHVDYDLSRGSAGPPRPPAGSIRHRCHGSCVSRARHRAVRSSRRRGVAQTRARESGSATMQRGAHGIERADRSSLHVRLPHTCRTSAGHSRVRGCQVVNRSDSPKPSVRNRDAATRIARHASLRPRTGSSIPSVVSWNVPKCMPMLWDASSSR